MFTRPHDIDILYINKSSTIFRKQIENVDANKWGQDGPFRKFHRFPKSCCVITSHLLARYLIRHCNVNSVVSIVHGEHPNDGWHYWVGLNDLIVDITADQFDALSGNQIVVGDTDWHNKCRILETRTVSYEFTDVDEGCDYADKQSLEYAYKELTCELADQVNRGLPH